MVQDSKGVGILVANGFSENEYLGIKHRLGDAGIEYNIISPEENEVRSYTSLKNEIDVDYTVEGLFERIDEYVLKSDPLSYEMVIIPGGSFSSYKLISDDFSIDFINEIYYNNKILAAISDGTQVISELDDIKGKFVTSPMQYKDDLLKKGALWVDNEIAIDKGLITSRNYNDLDIFMNKVVDSLIHTRVLKSYMKKYTV
ncbi:MAG: DJ-1/PfpI family protein [bacterium]